MKFNWKNNNGKLTAEKNGFKVEIQPDNTTFIQECAQGDKRELGTSMYQPQSKQKKYVESIAFDPKRRYVCGQGMYKVVLTPECYQLVYMACPMFGTKTPDCVLGEFSGCEVARQRMHHAIAFGEKWNLTKSIVMARKQNGYRGK